jgi:hypothetical protein
MEGCSMERKKIIWIFLITALFFVVLPAEAQLKSIYKFKDVKIPLNLEHKNVSIKAGTYDIDFLKNQAAGYYIMQIRKGRKKLCTVNGVELYYKTRGSQQLTDPEIPDEPRMKMKQNRTEEVLIVLFESGKKSKVYPFIKIEFKIKYI